MQTTVEGLHDGRASDPEASKVAQIIDWFLSCATIGSQLPVRVHDGGILNCLNAECGGCSRPIGNEAFRGTVATPFERGPVIVRAYGYCTPCHLFTPFDYRLRGANGQMVWEYQKDGVWVRELAKPHWLDRLASLFRFARSYSR